MLSIFQDYLDQNPDVTVFNWEKLQNTEVTTRLLISRYIIKDLSVTLLKILITKFNREFH